MSSRHTGWYYNGNTNASIALQNTIDTKTTVALTIFVSGRAISLGKRQLNPHETTTIKLPSPEGLGSANGPRSTGVRVEYEGKPGAVIAQGWIADESIGFSAPFAFHPKSNCNCSGDMQHQYGAGIMIDNGGMTGTIFSPYLAASNSSDRPLTINPVFSYGGKELTEHVRLPEIKLGPRQSTVVNLREFQENGTIPPWVELGNIDLQYKGEGGALVAELASVDQNGSFVSPVPLICSGNKSVHMSFWRTDGDWHSSVTIENIALFDNDIEIKISYSGGIYTLEKKIAAGASLMVSVNDLQQSQEPDKEGRRIPPSATLGGMNIWSSNIDDALIINAMLINPITRTCGSCNGQAYVNGWYLADKATYPGGPLYSGIDPHIVGIGFDVFINLHWSDGAQSTATIGNSSSSDPSIANNQRQLCKSAASAGNHQYLSNHAELLLY